MLPVFLLLLLQLVACSVTLVRAVRHPSWRAHMTAGVALGACLAVGSQVVLQQWTPTVVLWTLGLDALLLAQLRSRARRPPPRPRSGEAWWC